MRIDFTEARTGPEYLVAEASIYFEKHDGILSGTRLTGLDVCKDHEGEVYVTLPARRGHFRRDDVVYEFLRGGDEGVPALRRFKGAVIAAYREWERSRGLGVPAVEAIRQACLPGMEQFAPATPGMQR